LGGCAGNPPPPPAQPYRQIIDDAVDPSFLWCVSTPLTYDVELLYTCITTEELRRLIRGRVRVKV
jgi:hypothetical protein